MTQAFSILLPLALIFVVSRLLCSVCAKLHLPFVIGQLLAGILIGFIKFIPGQSIITDYTEGGLAFFAKIGVVLIMFSAGLGTDIKMVKSTGKAALLITFLGVAVPIGLGFLVACLFLNHGFANLTAQDAIRYFFYGVILTATSVSVTVATLKEMGKLNGKVGTAIVTAAILDDIIGVILLSFAAGLSGAGTNVGMVILKTVIYFAVAIPLGLGLRWLFKKMAKAGVHDDFLIIAGLAMAFVYAYCAEELCGVADITGAFFAGLMLSGTTESKKVDGFCTTLSVFFLPVFFANIGITTQFSAVDTGILVFGVCYVLAALVSKVVGCGTGALLCRFSVKESAEVGIGMMVRAEVLLICAQKGIDSGMVSGNIMPFIIAIILVSSLVTPLALKLLVGDKHHPHGGALEPPDLPAVDGPPGEAESVAPQQAMAADSTADTSTDH